MNVWEMHAELRGLVGQLMIEQFAVDKQVEKLTRIAGELTTAKVRLQRIEEKLRLVDIQMSQFEEAPRAGRTSHAKKKGKK